MNISEVENRVLEKVKSLLEVFNNQFEDRQITYKVNLKKEKVENIQDYLSELEILFYRNDNLYDIIEFFIFRNGKIYFEENKLMKDLFINIEEIIFSIETNK